MIYEQNITILIHKTYKIKNLFIITMSYNCSKCNKTLASKQSMIRHEKKCNGLSSLQCELCHKSFVCSSGKYKHKKMRYVNVMELL